jgi:hypothetical protein
MPAREYFSNSNKELVLVLDPDGENLKSMDRAFIYIKENMKPDEFDYHSPFFDSGEGYFIKDKINVKVTCSNWDGTEIRIPATLPSDQIEKVRGWAELIREGLKGQA